MTANQYCSSFTSPTNSSILIKKEGQLTLSVELKLLFPQTSFTFQLLNQGSIVLVYYLLVVVLLDGTG